MAMFIPARRCISAACAMALCLSVCLSFTSRCSTDTAERIKLGFASLDLSYSVLKANPGIVNNNTTHALCNLVLNTELSRFSAFFHNGMSTVAGVVNFVRPTAVCHTERRSPVFTTQRTWRSASRGASAAAKAWHIWYALNAASETVVPLTTNNVITGQKPQISR